MAVELIDPLGNQTMKENNKQLLLIFESNKKKELLS